MRKQRTPFEKFIFFLNDLIKGISYILISIGGMKLLNHIFRTNIFGLVTSLILYCLCLLVEYKKIKILEKEENDI